MRTTRYILGAIVLAGAVATISVGAAIGAFTGPTVVPDRSVARPANAQASPSAGIANVPGGTVAAFRAFQRATSASDAGLMTNPRALAGLYTAQRNFAANPSLARRVYSGSQGTIYVVPANGGQAYLVALDQQGGVSVVGAAISDALSRGKGIATLTDDGTTSTIVGVLPDTASTMSVVDGKGTSHTVTPSSDGGYWISVPAHARELVVTDTAGVVHTRRLP